MRTYSNNPALVVCDIDGTLTKNGTVYPSPYALKVIEGLHERKIFFGLASGRNSDNLLSLTKEWMLSFEPQLLIGGNGSEYYDAIEGKNNVLYILSQEDVRYIITTMLKKYPDLNVSIYRDGMRMLRYEDEMAVNSKKRNKMENVIVNDISQMWERPCFKVMFRVTEEVMRQIEPFAISISGDRFHAIKTQTTMLEFVHAKANKGDSLKRFCEAHGIDLKDVIAYGDMSNDNDLLLAAGTGVCMINGGEDTKRCADYITEKTNDEDGCAYDIDQYILKRSV